MKRVRLLLATILLVLTVAVGTANALPSFDHECGGALDFNCVILHPGGAQRCTEFIATGGGNDGCHFG